MFFTTIVSALSLVSFALAQNNTTVVTIQVGAEENSPGGIYQFIPPTVTAKNGTIINFQFTGVPGNHSVTQSTFANPCNPVPGGFDSGNAEILSPVSATPEWNLTITDDSQPIWFFCKQLLPAPHCGAGMVGAINPPATGNTFMNFTSNAVAQGANAASIGQGEGGLIGIGASASASIGPVPSGVTIFTGTPVGTGTGTSGSSSTQTAPGGGSPTTSPSGAGSIASANSFVAFFAILVCITLL